MSEPNLRKSSAVSCGFLRKSSVFCENLWFSAVSCALQMLAFPGEGVNLWKSVVFWKICILGSLCQLRSVTLSAPWYYVMRNRQFLHKNSVHNLVTLSLPPKAAKWWISSWISEKGPQTELQTISHNCANKLSENCEQTALWTNRRLWVITFQKLFLRNSWSKVGPHYSNEFPPKLSRVIACPD